VGEFYTERTRMGRVDAVIGSLVKPGAGSRELPRESGGTGKMPVGRVRLET
jgi:hypothetical protein